MKNSIPYLILKNTFPILLTLLIVSSCTDDAPEVFNIEPTLFGCWTHSHEEQDNGAEFIYRPCDYKEFPLSRFRKIYQFFENKECTVSEPGANDIPFTLDGTFEYNATNNIITITNLDGEVRYKLKILELNNDRLIFENR